MSTSNQEKMSLRVTDYKRAGKLIGNLIYVCAALLPVTLVASCSSVDRSRNLGNPEVPANTIAMQVCSNCHGAYGVSVSPNFPNLAAQQQPYLIAQLKSFKLHTRSDPAASRYMWGLSSHLTDDQITGLADYFAAQKPPTESVEIQGSVTDGQSIFEHGIAESNTPACSSCHGPKAEGNQIFPRLAGQHADYIVKQLKVFQETDDRPDAVLMKSVSKGLTPENMQSVALYLQAMQSVQ
ncbi:MAG TPA: c-type cytochrome [Burkholderiaceae bacterium]|jgi:cytochrome c553|nr:c-type cytochrome [Burkholderiaceae bacterium]